MKNLILILSIFLSLGLSAQDNVEISVINGHNVVVLYKNSEYFISINDGKLVNKKTGKQMKRYIRRKTDGKPEFLKYCAPIVFQMWPTKY